MEEGSAERGAGARLRDATVEPINGASFNADPTRVFGVRSTKNHWGPSSTLRRAPKFLFGDLTSVVIEGGGAIPSRLISDRIPTNWGPCSTSTAAPVSGDATRRIGASHRRDAAGKPYLLDEVAA